MIQRVEAPWQGVALVCRKCSKKLPGGFGPDDEKLSKALRRALRAAGRRRALRVVEVGCLGLCPKKAVTVAVSTDPAALYAVPGGTPMDSVIATLTLPAPPPAAPSPNR